MSKLREMTQLKKNEFKSTYDRVSTDPRVRTGT